MPRDRGTVVTSRGKKGQMRKHKQPKTVSKKAAKKTKEMMGRPSAKAYGKTTMKDVSPTRSVGYATVAPTKLPKRKKVRPTTKAGRKSLRTARKR